MSRLTRRVALIRPRVSATKTYAEFVAKVTADAASGTRAWDAVTALAAGNYITVCAAETGTLTGSSWASVFLGNTTGAPAMCRIVQHGLPSQAAFSAQVAAGRTVYAQVDVGATPTGYVALSRNGYTSLANATTVGPRVITVLRWYDDTLGPLESNPSTGSAPVPFTW